MKPPLTVNGITLRFLCLRDWCELSQQWLAARQQEQEQAMRRSGASAVDMAKAAQDYAAKRSTYGLLVEMCKTFDGAMLILERSAQRSGVLPETLHAAIEGMDPDSVAVLSMRACGWDLKVGEDAQGNV